MTELYVKRIQSLGEVSLPHVLSTHCGEYKNEALRLTSENSYFLLSEILKEKGFDSSRICFSPEGKPYLQGIFFSLSHSKDYIVIAVSDHEVGCDAEELIPEKRFHLADRILNQDEKTEFSVSEDKSLYLTTKWTLMESMGKARGCGIKEELFKMKKEGFTKRYGDTLVSVYPYDDMKLFVLGDGYFGKPE